MLYPISFHARTGGIYIVYSRVIYICNMIHSTTTPDPYYFRIHIFGIRNLYDATVDPSGVINGHSIGIVKIGGDCQIHLYVSNPHVTDTDNKAIRSRISCMQSVCRVAPLSIGGKVNTYNFHIMCSITPIVCLSKGITICSIFTATGRPTVDC